jgi:hypothetical protein
LRTLKILLVAIVFHSAIRQAGTETDDCDGRIGSHAVGKQVGIGHTDWHVNSFGWLDRATSKIFNVLNIISNIELGSSFLSNQYSHLTSDIVFTFNIKALCL